MSGSPLVHRRWHCVPDSSRRRERLLTVEYTNIVNARALRLCELEPRIQTSIVRDCCFLFHVYHGSRCRHKRFVDITSPTSVFRVSRNSDSKLIEIFETPRRYARRFSCSHNERESLSLARKW